MDADAGAGACVGVAFDVASTYIYTLAFTSIYRGGVDAGTGKGGGP